MSDRENFPYTFVAPGIADLRPYQPGKPIEELERELGIVNAVKLASNENPLGPSPAAMAALTESLGQLERYPDANGFELKAALAAQLDVMPEQITLGNGSNDVLDLLARCFALPQSEVIFSKYAFLVYHLITKAAGAVPIVVPANAWGHDLTEMQSAVTDRARMVFIANPNNPTGTYLSADALLEFLQQIPANIIVVIDEAYYEYVSKKDYSSMLAYLQQFPNLVITRTFSKVYGLAGLRIGFSVSSIEIADLLNRVRQPFNVNVVAQDAALAALLDPEHVSRSVESNQKQMEKLVQSCEKLGLPYIDSEANFLTVEFGAKAADVYQALLRKGVIVRPIENYGMPDHLRITIGRAGEMDRLIATLPEVLAG